MAPAAVGEDEGPLCPQCGLSPLTARQRYCSGKCRAAASRERKFEKALGAIVDSAERELSILVGRTSK